MFQKFSAFFSNIQNLKKIFNVLVDRMPPAESSKQPANKSLSKQSEYEKRSKIQSNVPEGQMTQQAGQVGEAINVTQEEQRSFSTPRSSKSQSSVRSSLKKRSARESELPFYLVNPKLFKKIKMKESQADSSNSSQIWRHSDTTSGSSLESSSSISQTLSQVIDSIVVSSPFIFTAAAYCFQIKVNTF